MVDRLISLRDDPTRWSTFVLQGSNTTYHWEGVGPLSIKLFFHGRAHYDAGGGRFAVDEGSYLILNEGQRYTITVDAPRPVESFCLFFRKGMADEVRRSLRERPETLLDAPDDSGVSVAFFERTYSHDELLSPALLALRREIATGGDDPFWLNERLRGVLARLLARHDATRAEALAFPAARPATREELYRRVHLARDFLAASYAEPVTLDDAARVACLSPNHLLRSFRALLGTSPHQYLTERRIAEARRLLAGTDLPVTEICRTVGFASHGSFTALFTRHVGAPPERFRRANR